MWQRFTERARKVVFYAQEEAQKFGEGYVSTEHLLLGITREPDSAAAQVLNRLGVSLARVRSEVEKQLPRGEARHTQDMTLTPRAKRVIDLAYDEARNLNNNHMGTEHLLLGLVREGDGLAGRVLAKLGVEVRECRITVVQLQYEAGPRDTPSPESASAVLARSAMNDLGRELADYWPFITRAARNCLYEACTAAADGLSSLWPAHIFVAIAKEKTVAGRTLETLSVSRDEVSEAIRANLAAATEKGKPGAISSDAVAVVAEAETISQEMHHEHIGTEHLLLAIVERDADGFADFGITREDVLRALKAL